MEYLTKLPEESISLIISYTSPRDACRSSAVSRSMKEYADSNAVWRSFLPSDCQDIVSTSSASTSSPLVLMPKKELYFYLCQNPIFIGNGNMSFSLEKESGKKCYMIGAKDLSIAWGDTSSYWKWKSLPESRFSQVAKLRYVWWLDIKARIETKVLSPETTYAAYFVFKFVKSRHGFNRRPVELCVNVEGSECKEKHRVHLDLPVDMPQEPRLSQRRDGWMEVEMGSFYNEHGDDGTVLCSLIETKDYKRGLIVEGIEFRPKS
ncbi:putative F-box protein PP2-B2 [Tripterygium wilfordii]|uniref:putative F-box protein PP2-B2 n=1 Tax=Tripterygium wilfordii TaxID=458696 RepID=UPI0018F7EA98|nr:putative F-box protein PP2-B2 [Tripterygium wilfordii]